MKNTFLRKTLAIVLLTVILSAGLTALVFRYAGIGAYADIKLRELAPSAAFLAERSAEYLQGTMSYRNYHITVVESRNIWGATPYIFTADQMLFVSPENLETAEAQEMLALAKKNLNTVLSGKSVSHGSWLAADAVVGEPILSKDGSVIGAVFLIKPIRELNAAMNSLWTALLVAIVVVTLLMLLPAYLMSRKLTGPLKQMNEAALAMAQGNFSVRASVSGNDEIAQLGKSLNDLSSALSHTIENLTFERNRLRTTLDGLGEGVISVNTQKEIMQYNLSSVRLLGGREGERPETLSAFIALLPCVEETLQTGVLHVMEQKCREAVICTTVSPLRDGSGTVEGAVLLVQDVTESVRLEQTRRDYVANVSHELRTPLASIRSLSDALSDGLIKKEEDRIRYYGYIQKESMRLSRLIDDLLELSRLQSGSVALTKQRMSIRELLYDVAERYENTAQDCGMSVCLDLPEDLPEVYGNPDRTEQVLIVLLDNAIKHSSSSAEPVYITAGTEADQVTVRVSNAGTIAEEDIDHLFERFYKADRSHSGEGTGLGLSIAKEIMDLLGEKIWVENRDGRVEFGFTLGRNAEKV